MKPPAGQNITDDNHIANVNPMRYRGYYQDTETGMYYLQSRYFDPVVHRFINADGMMGSNQDLLGYNIYAYCSNNPVTRADPTGYTKEESDQQARFLVFVLLSAAFYQEYIDRFNREPVLNNTKDLREMMGKL